MFLHRPDAILHLQAFGPGPRRIIGLGGWIGSGELWHPPFGPLSRHWRCVAVDHRGSGASSADGISFEAMVGDLLAVLEGEGRAVLAAESLGAMVAAEVARRAPDRVAGLVLAGARLSGLPDSGSAALAAGCRADFDATMAAFVEACVPEVDGAPHRAWGRQVCARSSAGAALALLAAAEGRDQRPALRGFAGPVLFLHGAHDAIAPLGEIEALVASMPDARLAVIDDAGHVPTVTRPERVAAEIEAAFP
ncbi:MAG: alpha/beta hydrolase [Rhodobacteraceae bacterium]|nr:alpha/beta hydrolase [Paracoccaceae bacterium]